MSSRSTPEGTRTSDRIVAAAMELFGRQGYKATTVAQIEAAAGLSAGAGGLYRHFPSKRALLEEGLRRQAAAGGGLQALLAGAGDLASAPLVEQLRAVARAGLRRLEQERDVNRLLLHDLADFPDLLEDFRRHELGAVADGVTGYLRARTGPSGVDVDALAAVVISAVSHYWVLVDVFGQHPLAISEDRYLDEVAALAAARLSGAF